MAKNAGGKFLNNQILCSFLFLGLPCLPGCIPCATLHRAANYLPWLQMLIHLWCNFSQKLFLIRQAAANGNG